MQFLNEEGKNRKKIYKRLCNMYTKSISQSNVYEWIKKFNKERTELYNQVWLCWLSDLINEETFKVVHCLLDNDCHPTISDLHHETAAQNMYLWSSVQWWRPSDQAVWQSVIFMQDNRHPHTTDLPQWLLKDFKWKIFEYPPYSPNLAPPIFMPFRR